MHGRGSCIEAHGAKRWDSRARRCNCAAIGGVAAGRLTGCQSPGIARPGDAAQRAVVSLPISWRVYRELFLSKNLARLAELPEDKKREMFEYIKSAMT